MGDVAGAVDVQVDGVGALAAEVLDDPDQVPCVPGDAGRRFGALTLISATDGNHGRAVARTARLLGLPARVYVPKGVPDVVIDRINAEGARIAADGGVTVISAAVPDAVPSRPWDPVAPGFPAPPVPPPRRPSAATRS